MAPGLTQPPTEMSTRNISWGKGGRCLGLTTLTPSCIDCLEIWETQPPGALRAYPACNGIALPLLLGIRRRSSVKSRSQQQIKANYPSTFRLLRAVLISVIFCSSLAAE